MIANNNKKMCDSENHLFLLTWQGRRHLIYFL